MSEKIAFVTPVYSDTNFDSGGIKLNFILLDGLVKKGYSIDVFTDRIIYNDKCLVDNIYPLKDFSQKKSNYSLILSDKAFVQSDITYIHDHSYPYRTAMMSNKFSHFLYKIFCNKRHIKRQQEFFKTRKNICSCKTVIVSSSVLKKDIMENYGVEENKIVIIPPPIENSNISQLKCQQRKKSFTFGISAVGFKRKGGYIALKAIKELVQSEKFFKVIFIYPSNNFFVNFLIYFYGIKKYCQFIPIQKNMKDFYSSIDCLIMPSLIEPFGMVATEALSFGIPVITGEHCGASDFISNGKNGFLYNYSRHNVDGLVLAMKKIMSLDSFALTKMKNLCKISIQDLYSENFVNCYLDLMKK